MPTLKITNRPAPLTAECAQGKTFGPYTIEIRNPAAPHGNGLAVDLTGWELRGHVRKKYSSTTIAATFITAISNQTSFPGQATFMLTAAQTAAIPCGEKITASASKYVYDLELFDGSGKVIGLIRNPFIMEAEATR